MVWIDYTIIGIIAISSLMSIKRGFIQEALSLVIWVGAFLVASHFRPYLNYHLPQINDEMVRNGVSVSVLFVATLVAGAIVSALLRALIGYTGLSATDRVLGLCFGFLRGIFIIAAILFVVDSFTPYAKSEEWRQSILIPHFRYIVAWFFEYLRNNSTLIQHYV